jgi:molybdenum cofactor guanylyltransferase
VTVGGRAAGVVLAGGRSSRMGRTKAALDWHGSTLLRRTTGVLARAVDGPVVVVRAPGAPLPALPAAVEVVADPVEGRGPLQGIATGLAAVAGRVPLAFVCATDMPLLHPAFVTRVLDELARGADVVLPVAAGHPQPLAAGYRTALAPRVAALVADGRLRPAMLFAEVDVRRLDAPALLADPRLAAADPALDSLLNVNEPAEYAAAAARPAPLVTVRRGAAERVLRAATLAAAGAVAPTCVLNGRRIAADPHLPLVEGDVLDLDGS